MKRLSILGGLAVSLFALPALAQETAYTTSGVTLEAGPAADYPAVGSFGAGTPVTLYGCLDGYVWCDVSYQDARGWVDGQALAYPYEDQRVPIAVYGPQLSLPVVTFTFGSYWDEHYHDRPFFGQRERFEHHAPPPPPPHRAPPPPLPARGGPGPHPGEAHPPERGPGPAVAHPEAARREAAHPQPAPRPQPQPVAHPQEAPHPAPAQAPHPVAPAAQAPHPEPAAHPPEAHPAEEHHEGPAEQPH